MPAGVGVGTRARDTEAGRARIADALALLQGGSRVARVRTADGFQGLKDFEIARLKDWCLETETPWQPRWYGEVASDESVGATSGTSLDGAETRTL